MGIYWCDCLQYVKAAMLGNSTQVLLYKFINFGEKAAK
jgi:hypothetical protein